MAIVKSEVSKTNKTFISAPSKPYSERRRIFSLSIVNSSRYAATTCCVEKVITLKLRELADQVQVKYFSCINIPAQLIAILPHTQTIQQQLSPCFSSFC